MVTRIGGIFLLVIAVAFCWALIEYNRVSNAAAIYDQPEIIVIDKGDSFNRITQKLIKQQVAIDPYWFKLFAYKNKVINKLKAGEYELKVGITLPQILDLFVEGKTRQYSITFPEGWSFKQIIQLVQENPQLKKTLKKSDVKQLMLKLGSDYKHPEGLFFPDTYFFDKNTTDFSLLKTSYDKMQLVLQQEWEDKENDLPLKNAYQALILASIVEKETGEASERAQIAGVFIRRLNKGMLLQTDPTVIYGMGDRYKGNIRYRDLRRATKYNTYVIRGLPPTPIAMPGRDAIHATLHPKKGNSLYFVAKGQKGTHYFSATLREHNNAVNKYQRRR